MKQILILNGPNLNRLGTREPAVYGVETLSDIENLCLKEGKRLNLQVDFKQSNCEHELIELCHEACGKFDGIIINAAGLTHTSVSLRDALVITGLPIIEVHISNVYAREDFRHTSFISGIALGVICGLGSGGYVYALQALNKHLN